MKITMFGKHSRYHTMWKDNKTKCGREAKELFDSSAVLYDSELIEFYTCKKCYYSKRQTADVYYDLSITERIKQASRIQNWLDREGKDGIGYLGDSVK